MKFKKNPCTAITPRLKRMSIARQEERIKEIEDRIVMSASEEGWFRRSLEKSLGEEEERLQLILNAPVSK
jgi:hypothetical protein